METDYDFATQQQLVARHQSERIERMNRYCRVVRGLIKEAAPALSTVGVGVTAELIRFHIAGFDANKAACTFISNRQGNP